MFNDLTEREITKKCVVQKKIVELFFVLLDVQNNCCFDMFCPMKKKAQLPNTKTNANRRKGIKVRRK